MTIIVLDQINGGERWNQEKTSIINIIISVNEPVG